MKFLLFFIPFFLTGCFDSGQILAKVNNNKLTQEDLHTLNIEKENQEKFINEWVKMKLFASSVKDNELIKLKTINYKDKVKANYFISNLLKSKKIEKKELLDYYNANYQNFYKTITKYKFQKIYVSNKKKKDVIINKISQNVGVKFSDLAKQFSEDIYGKNGGYTGFVDKNSIKDIVWEKLINSERNKYLWIDVPDGYVIGRWYDRKDFKMQLSFDQVKDKIQEILIKKNRENLLKQELEKLKRNNKVEINLKYN